MQGWVVASLPDQVGVHVVLREDADLADQHLIRRPVAVVNPGCWRGCDYAYPGGGPGRRPGSSSQGNVASQAAATRNAAMSS